MVLKFVAAVIFLILLLHPVKGLQRIIEISEDINEVETPGENNHSNTKLSDSCCVYGKCSCPSLYYALANLTSNVLLNIRTNVKLSSSIIMLHGLVNISIVGQNIIVYCNRNGGIHFNSCNNCMINGILWERCGASDNKPALHFQNSSSISINYCAFQESVGQSLVLSSVSGDVNINYCNFVLNTHYNGHGVAVHYSSSSFGYHSNITIISCKFLSNKAKSVVYFGPSYDETSSHFHLQRSVFEFNEAVPIYLSNQKLYVSKGVYFIGNMAENGGGIFISNHSKVTFLKNADVRFQNNTAYKNGGAIYLADDSSVEFIEQPLLHDDSNPKEAFLFACNTAEGFGKDIYAYQSYVSFDYNTIVTFNGCRDRHDSGALYIEHHSNITFKGNSNVTFTDYEYYDSGALYIHDQSEVRFEGDAAVKIYGSNGQRKSGAMYIHQSTATFKENCDVIFDKNSNEGALYVRNSFVRFEEFCRVTFTSNDACNDGGAAYIDNYSIVTFEGNSTVVFDNNVADYNGGAMLINDHSTVLFQGNSKIRLHNNSAHGDGGAICVEYFSSIIFESNSAVAFSNNTAKDVGGAFYTTDNSNIRFMGNSMTNFSENVAIYGAVIYSVNSHVTFEENSIIAFKNNKADENGGAVYVKSFSTITFAGNSTITFEENIAGTDGGAVYIINAFVTFASNSKIYFIDNFAKRGGAMYFFHSCINSTQSIHFTGNSMITFDHNNANDKGGAVCVDSTDSTIIQSNETCNPLNFNKNSAVMFTNNMAINGGAVYLGYSSNMIAQENSKLLFSTNQAHIGGAIYSYASDMIFQGSSNATFSNNFALQDGGVLFSYRLCNISFLGNSTVVFERNKAVNGGALHVGYKINIMFKGNSISIFKFNQAYNGGGIYSYVSNITFQENSTVTFKNNVAFQNGGALYFRTDNFSFTENYLVTFAHNGASQGKTEDIPFSSAVKFRENCKVLFTENEAIEYGGVIHSSVNSVMLYDGQANVTFQSNKAKSGGAVSLHESFITTRLNSNIVFKNNSAQMGGAVYNSLSNITFAESSSIRFIENTALQDGGAVYLSDHSKFILTNNATVIFTDNFATDDGTAIYALMKESWLYFNTSEIYFSANNFKKSIYINVPKSCDKNCLLQRVVNLHKNISLPVVTSPRELILHDPVKCISTNNTECNAYYINDIMLGQQLKFNACVVDYYDQPTDELTQFLLTGINQEHNYVSAKYMTVSCDHTTQGVSIIGNMNVLSNYSMLISMNAGRTSQSKTISVNLIVELSKCRLGFWYSSNTQICECYDTSNVVSCSGSSSTIKRGYWFGIVDGKSTITSCPNNYCNFTCCEITNGIYHLSPIRANQCRSHRSGIACGACETGYTLTFDSPKCIEVNKCTTGQMVLVTVLSFLYWVAVIIAVFAMMHFKIGIGSLYAIIYYYSIVDILLRQVSFVSNGLYITINTLSSLAKLTPQFLGQLCFVRNMSGIDQQFVHYVHPVVVSVLLVVIIILAKRSRRISLFVSRGIIHFICFLLLLSYTSVATTSLLLMRSMTFMDINKVYTYLSPDVEYFHGRHLAYGIVAMVFIVLVVVSLPLLLLLEPFLNGKVNFIKIKPLLDQFQGGYKDKYRYFAAYYLICRIVIIALVIAGNSDDLTTHYILIATCAVIALVHLTVRPYADKIHNIFDGIVLHVIVITSVLPVTEYVDNYNEILVSVFAHLCTVLPLISFVIIKLWINKNKIYDIVKSLSVKYLHKYQAIPTEELPITETVIRNPTCTVIDIRPTEEHNSDKMWYRDSFVDDLDEIDALNDIKNF